MQRRESSTNPSLAQPANAASKSSSAQRRSSSNHPRLGSRILPQPRCILLPPQKQRPKALASPSYSGDTVPKSINISFASSPFSSPSLCHITAPQYLIYSCTTAHSPNHRTPRAPSAGCLTVTKSPSPTPGLAGISKSLPQNGISTPATVPHFQGARSPITTARTGTTQNCLIILTSRSISVKGGCRHDNKIAPLSTFPCTYLGVNTLGINIKLDPLEDTAAAAPPQERDASMGRLTQSSRRDSGVAGPTAAVGVGVYGAVSP